MSQLPFDKLGAIHDQSGNTTSSNVPCAVWPSRSGVNSEAGRMYDHEGECPISYAAELRLPNRVLVVGDVRYRVIDAIPHQFVPHVSLLLREARSGG